MAEEVTEGSEAPDLFVGGVYRVKGDPLDEHRLCISARMGRGKLSGLFMSTSEGMTNEISGEGMRRFELVHDPREVAAKAAVAAVAEVMDANKRLTRRLELLEHAQTSQASTIHDLESEIERLHAKLAALQPPPAPEFKANPAAKPALPEPAPPEPESEASAAPTTKGRRSRRR